MSKVVCTSFLPISLLLSITAEAQQLPLLHTPPELSFNGTLFPAPNPDQWFGGFYPAPEAGRFPTEQEAPFSFGHAVGYIADHETWASLWGGFDPDSNVPVVDFNNQMIIYARGANDLNNLIQVAVGALDDQGVVDVGVLSTRMASWPSFREDIAWSATTIDLAGVRYLRVDGQLLSVARIPEPSTWALALVACLASVVFIRRAARRS